MIRYDRRRFLGTIGLTAGGAMLPTLADRLVCRAYGQATKRQPCFVIWIVGGAIQCRQGSSGWGLAPPEFGDSGGLEVGGKTAFTWPKKLEPLEGMRDKVAIIDGLCALPGGGGHGNGFITTTCTPGSPGGPSIDQAIAQVIGRDSAMGSILVGCSDRSLRLKLERETGMFAAAKGSAVPHVASVPLLLRELFGAGTPGGKPPSPRPLLDSMRLDLKRLERKLAVEERTALEDYLRLIAQYEAQYVARTKIACVGPGSLPALGAEDITTSMTQAITLAFQCGVSRVAGVAIGATGGDHEDMPPHPVLLGGDKFFDGHSTMYDYARQAGLIQRFHMSLIADMHKALGDDLVTVYTSESGDADGNGSHFGHHANAARVPAIVVGGARGGLKTGGRYLRYPMRYSAETKVSNAHSMADLYLAAAAAVGAPLQTFGGGQTQPTLGSLPDLNM